MVYLVDGSTFGIGLESPEHSDLIIRAPRLQQTHMTALISVSLVCIRLLLNAWATISAWRVAFILLETSGMTLRQLCWTVSFGIPLSPFDSKGGTADKTKTIRRPGEKKAGRREKRISFATAWAMSSICAILLPSQVAAPIASGSVSWIPKTISSPSLQPLRNVPVPGPGYHWDWYQMYPAVRSTLVLRSAAYATMIAAQMNSAEHVLGGGSAKVPAWRSVPSAEGLPLKSTVDNITIPYFTIHGWEWIQDVSLLPDPLLAAVVGQGMLNMTNEENPLQDPIEGNAALLRTEPWRQSTKLEDGHYRYPSPRTLAAETMYLAVLVQRIPGDTCRPTSDTFGELVPHLVQHAKSSFLGIPHSNNHTDCYIFASFSITAGSQTCSRCSVSHPSTVVSTTAARPPGFQPDPDPLITETLAMLPEVMHAITTMSVTSSSQLGKLPQWTQRLLQQAYFATWTEMSIYFADPPDFDSDVPEPLSSGTTVPIQVVLASINRDRMWLWLGLNVLVTVSGVLLLAWQTGGCEAKVVIDPVLVAVMLDSQRLLDGDDTGLCNASRLADADEELGVLRLRRIGGGKGGHFALDRE
ncbi:hypothetical protein B0T14DRAFT_565153 [Immersiella caudata]|uniref:Uncharacterized protein n=1 Tax=Immersiella caudata TaxID=314043 RepID=A0AA39WY80_9PEZI|nr:hypothetical protein B0T14DRAFT_565153 [Immersiella caudata]